MKTARFVPLLVLTLVLAGSYSAPAAEDTQRAYIGVRLDTTPLSDLLIKHLRLKPDQGLRIQNVQVGSPADKAGLERDDLIVAFQGNDVTDYNEFVEKIKKAGVDATVNLEIIHLGERKTVNLTLAAFSGEIEWKYPQEPQTSGHWQPGRMFRLKPGDKMWEQIPFEHFPDSNRIKKFFSQQHYFHQTLPDGREYDITIEGDPRDDKSRITVKIDREIYETTVGDLDKLPQEYRQAARDALESAKKNAAVTPSPPTPRGEDRDFFSKPFPWSEDNFNFGPGFDGDFFNRMQKQMDEMMKRMRDMEQRNQRLYEKFPELREDESLTEDAEEL